MSKILSNCSKQLVTPVNLTKKINFNLTCLSLTNYLISRIGRALPKLKIAFSEVIGHFAVFQCRQQALRTDCPNKYTVVFCNTSFPSVSRIFCSHKLTSLFFFFYFPEAKRGCRIGSQWRWRSSSANAGTRRRNVRQSLCSKSICLFSSKLNPFWLLGSNRVAKEL